MFYFYISLLQQIIIFILLWLLLTTAGRRQFHRIRKEVRHFWQRQKDSKFRQWHPKTPEACPQCCAGIKLQVARI